MSRRADELIAELGLLAHPEGGYYRQTFRGGLPLESAALADLADRADREAAPRPPLTSIYFLLRGGEPSRWHRLDADEVWSFHEGAPLRLYIAGPEVPPSQLAGVQPQPQLLGLDLAAGQRPQLVVPKGAYQRAESAGDYTLVGCAMGPGFSAAGFELL